MLLGPPLLPHLSGSLSHDWFVRPFDRHPALLGSPVTSQETLIQIKVLQSAMTSGKLCILQIVALSL